MNLPPQNVLALLQNPPADGEQYSDEDIQVLAAYINNEANDDMTMTLWGWIQPKSFVLCQIHPYIEMRMVETAKRWHDAPDEDYKKVRLDCTEMLEAAGVKFRVK